MKKSITLILLLLLNVTILTAQNFSKGSITLTNGSKLEGRIAIDNAKKAIVLKENYTSKTYGFNQIASATLNNRNLIKLTINESDYFGAAIVNGTAALYQISEDQYLVVTNDETSKIINLTDDRSKITGVLTVLFSDCNDMRTSLNKVDVYNESSLKRNVEAYNNCDYSAYAPTQKEIEAAATYNTDIASFYIGVGAGSSSITFFDRNDGESIISAQLQAGVIATPSFLGKLQSNLFFTLEGNAAFSGDSDFSNAPNTINFNVNTFRLLIGLEYQFNKEGQFKPYIGASVGAVANYYDGSIDGNDFDISGGNPIFVPRIGARYKLKNGSHLGATLSYITGYENDLTFPTETEIIPLEIRVETFTFGLNYFF